MGQKQAKNHHDSFGKSRLPRAALPVSLELGIFRAVCDLIAFVSEVLSLKQSPARDERSLWHYSVVTYTSQPPRTENVGSTRCPSPWPRDGLHHHHTPPPTSGLVRRFID